MDHERDLRKLSDMMSFYVYLEISPAQEETGMGAFQHHLLKQCSQKFTFSLL